MMLVATVDGCQGRQRRWPGPLKPLSLLDRLTWLIGRYGGTLTYRLHTSRQVRWAVVAAQHFRW